MSVSSTLQYYLWQRSIEQGYYQGCVDYYEHTGGNYGGMDGGTDWHRGNETTCYADSGPGIGNYTAKLIVPDAQGYLQRMAKTPEKPFFLYLPFHLIHGPNQVPKQYEDLYDLAYPSLDPEISAEAQGLCGVCACPSHSGGAAVTWAQCRTVLGMASALDEAVGDVFDTLRSTGGYNHSVIVYTSDNGAQGGQGGTSYPLKGWKTQLFGTHKPSLVAFQHQRSYLCLTQREASECQGSYIRRCFQRLSRGLSIGSFST
eukprot:SAG31_NODE_4955_length_2836_cov_1.640482_1_plen_258_part_00